MTKVLSPSVSMTQDQNGRFIVTVNDGAPQIREIVCPDENEGKRVVAIEEARLKRLGRA